MINHLLWRKTGLTKIQTCPKDLIEETNCLLEELINCSSLGTGSHIQRRGFGFASVR